jgi:hypothetical protein
MKANRKRLALGIAAAALVVAVVLVTLNARKSAQSASSDETTADQQSSSQTAVSMSGAGKGTQAAPAPVLSAQNTALPDLVGDISVRPTVDRVRAEVAANPHATPMVLLDFASKMASMMKVAETTPEAAEQAALQLDQCVQGDRSQWIDSARALCLANYARLAHVHPELKDRFLSARDSAEPRVAMLVRQMNALAR